MFSRFKEPTLCNKRSSNTVSLATWVNMWPYNLLPLPPTSCVFLADTYFILICAGEGQVFGVSQSGPQGKVFSKPPNLNTQEIKLIVDGLNRPPFMCHLSMVEFDDKAPLELLELVNKVFSHLDDVHRTVDMQKET